MSVYMARRSNAMCATKFPSTPVKFAPQQCCDPVDNASSFYRYAIAFSSFFVFTHEAGMEGLLRSTADCKNSSLMPCASMVLGQQQQLSNDKVPTARPIGVCVPIGAHERELLGLVAWTHRPLYPTLDNLLESAQQTKFYLMPTMDAGHCVTGVKCNAFLRATNGDCNEELKMRNEIAQSLGADGVRNLNSHTFSLTWKV